MIAPENVPCRIIGQVFVDRIVWILVAEGEVIGSGVSADFRDLRWTQLRAGILSVSLFAEKKFRDIARAACTRHAVEWRTADDSDRRLLENFFARKSNGFADRGSAEKTAA